MTGRAQVVAAVVRVSVLPDVIEFKKAERLTAHGRWSASGPKGEPADNGDRGGKVFLVRFCRDLR